MKKIVLKKMVIARIESNEMNHLRGGSDSACRTKQAVASCPGYICPTYVTCPPIGYSPTNGCSPTSGCTCGTEWTCNGR